MSRKTAGALQSEATSEDVKGAAALALGGVAVGNLGAYLPTLLSAVRGAVSARRTSRVEGPAVLAAVGGNTWINMAPGFAH